MSIFLWGTLFVMFSIPHLLMFFVGSFEYPSWVIDKVSIFVVLFCIFYMVGIKLIPWNNRPNISLLVPENKSYITTFVFLLFVLIFVRTLVLYRATGSLLNTSWAENRNVSDEVFFMKLYAYFYYVFSSVLLLCFLYRTHLKIVVVIALLVFGVILSRNRMEILPLFISIYWFYILKENKFGGLFFIKCLLLLVCAVYSIFALLIFRYYGSIDMFLSSDIKWGDFNEVVTNMLFEGDGELALRKVFYYFVYHDNDFGGFGEGHTYFRILLWFLPTSLSFGIKPDDFAITMGQAWIPGIANFSVHPTLFGDCYANFGMCGCFLGLFWGIFIGVLDSYIRKAMYNNIKGFLLLILVSSNLVTIARGSVYNGFMCLFVGVIILNIIFKFLSFHKSLYS